MSSPGTTGMATVSGEIWATGTLLAAVAIDDCEAASARNQKPTRVEMEIGNIRQCQTMKVA